MSESTLNLLRRAVALQRDGRRVMGCLLVKARGSTPQSAGAFMLVDDAAETHGTIGGGCVEAEARRRVVALIGEGGSGLLSFKLDHDYGWDDGLICGGTITLAVAPMPGLGELEGIIEAMEARRDAALTLHVEGEEGPQRHTLHLPPRERLYIAGAGHVGQALARLATELDFEVTVFDDRPDLLERVAAHAAATRCDDIARSIADAPIDARCSVVIVTRGHRHDERVLAEAVGRGARYVGMIGSRRKVKLTFDDLREHGVPEAHLAEVHAPIGIDIGAVSVAEIALSIAAQLVQVRQATDDRVTVVDQEAAGPRPD